MKRTKYYINPSDKNNWECSLNFEKVKSYLPHFKSVIQVPIYIIGVDL